MSKVIASVSRAIVALEAGAALATGELALVLRLGRHAARGLEREREDHDLAHGLPLAEPNGLGGTAAEGVAIPGALKRSQGEYRVHAEVARQGSAVEFLVAEFERELAGALGAVVEHVPDKVVDVAVGFRDDPALEDGDEFIPRIRELFTEEREDVVAGWGAERGFGDGQRVRGGTRLGACGGCEETSFQFRFP